MSTGADAAKAISVLLWLALPVAAGRAAGPAPGPATGLPLLTNVASVRRLPVEEARRGYGVTLRGVVTYYEQKWDTLFLQDDSGGIYVYPSDQPRPAFRPGQVIEVEGRTAPGSHLMANAVIEQRLTITGTGRLPAAVPATFDQLATSKQDGQFVEVEGIVRRLWSDRSRMEIDLGLDGGSVRAHLPRAPGQSLRRELLHARVRVQAVCGMNVNEKEQLLGVRLFVPDLTFLKVVSAAPTNVFDQAPQPLAGLSRFNLQYVASPRIRVSGIVALRWPSGKLIIRDDTGGLEIEPGQARLLTDPDGETWPNPTHPALQVGDRVDAAGYPAMRKSTPVLGDAELRKLGGGSVPTPLRTSARQVLAGGMNTVLVELEARMVDFLPPDPAEAGVQRWLLEADGSVFEARFEAVPRGSPVLPETVLRLTGICVPAPDDPQKSFRLLLNSPADAVVLQKPRWWLAGPVPRILGIALVLALAGLGWVMLLRREVAQRTAALSASEARKAAVLETAPDAILTIRHDGQVLDFNPAAERIFGYARTEVIGRPFAELLIAPGLRKRYRDGLARAVRRGNTALLGRRMQLTGMRKDGAAFQAEVVLARITGDGPPVFTGHVQDISQRQRSEHLQRAIYQISEATHAVSDLDSLYRQIHSIIQGLMAARNFYIALYDAATDELRFPYYADETGPAPPPRKSSNGLSEYVMKTRQPLLADRVRLKELAASGVLQIGQPAEVWLGVPLTVNQTVFGVMAVQDYHTPGALGEEQKQIMAYVARQTAVAIDRKRAEAELIASEARLRESQELFLKAFNANPSNVSISRQPDGGFLEVNEAFLEFTGYQREEVIGRTSVEIGLWAEPEQRDQSMRDLRQFGAIRNRECRIATQGGVIKTVLLSAELIEIDRQPCVLAVSVDISQLKEAELQLLQALAREKELSELKSSFVSMVSHEFRTPLGVIMSSSEILQRYLERLSPDEREKHLGSIVRSTRNLSNLIEEVLLLSRAEEGRIQFNPAPLDLASLCRHLADEVMSATGHQCPIFFAAASSLEGARADASLLRHVLTNLLSNAVKYSPAGRPVQLAAVRADQAAVFEVRDQGIGITLEDQKHLFQAFRRGRNVGNRPGSGLGLVIVRRCVKLHGGEIQVDSKPGEGTIVTVRLPLFYAGQEAAGGEASQQPHIATIA